MLNKFVKGSLCSVVWVNRDKTGLFESEEFIPNKRELKRKYPGQTYMVFPFTYNNEIKFLTTDNESTDGYVVVSKRDFRQCYPRYKYSKKDVIIPEIITIVNDFQNNFNEIVKTNINKRTQLSTK